VDAKGGVIHGKGGDVPGRAGGQSVTEFKVEDFPEDSAARKSPERNEIAKSSPFDEWIEMLRGAGRKEGEVFLLIGSELAPRSDRQARDSISKACRVSSQTGKWQIVTVNLVSGFTDEGSAWRLFEGEPVLIFPRRFSDEEDIISPSR
jgi:hypothetical protein